jgi:hypothetical protein
MEQLLKRQIDSTETLRVVISIQFCQNYEVRGELVHFQERLTSFKAVQAVSRNSSFIIVEGKMLVVQQGMEQVTDSQ